MRIQRLYPTLTGIVCYSLLSLFFDFFPFRLAPPLYLNPALCLPIFLGFFFGPAAGFLTGFLGAVIADYFSFGHLYINWEIAFGAMGLISSVGHSSIRKGIRVIHLAFGFFLSIVASSVGTLFAVSTDIIQFPGQATLLELTPTLSTNVFNGSVFFLILAYLYKAWKEDLMEETAAAATREETELAAA